VPDGDTGTNMHLTMQSVRRQLSDAAPDDMEGVARALSYGSLLGARGNSGVILSQILKGFAESIRHNGRVSGADLAEALSAGSDSAYAAVMKPVEGTILTVAREAAEAAEKRFTEGNGEASVEGTDAAEVTPLALLDLAVSAGRASL